MFRVVILSTHYLRAWRVKTFLSSAVHIYVDIYPVLSCHADCDCSAAVTRDTSCCCVSRVRVVFSSHVLSTYLSHRDAEILILVRWKSAKLKWTYMLHVMSRICGSVAVVSTAATVSTATQDSAHNIYTNMTSQVSSKSLVSGESRPLSCHVTLQVLTSAMSM